MFKINLLSSLLWWDSWDSVSLNASFIMAISLRICFLVSLRFLTLPSISSRFSSLLFTMLDGLELVLVLPSGFEWDLINEGGGARLSPFSPDLCLWSNLFCLIWRIFSTTSIGSESQLRWDLTAVFLDCCFSFCKSIWHFFQLRKWCHYFMPS